MPAIEFPRAEVKYAPSYQFSWSYLCSHQAWFPFFTDIVKEIESALDKEHKPYGHCKVVYPNYK